MSSPLEINIEPNWMPADGSPCCMCKEPMFGKMYQYFLFQGTEASETKFKLCETCYNSDDD